MRASGLIEMGSHPYEKKILVVGVNPALQKVLFLDEIEPGEVNRASKVYTTSAGKGANFAKAASLSGSSPVIYQFSGGINGRLFLAELKRLKIRNITVLVKTETRCCTTCIETGRRIVTEYIEPSGEIPPEKASELMSAIEADIAGFDAVAICGTYPPGLNPGFYGKISELASDHGIPLFVDACCDIKAVLENGVEILKVNSKEISELSGCNSIRDAAKLVMRSYNVKAIAVTAGGGTSWLFAGDDTIKFKLPEIKVLNSTGAGDTVSGVFLSEYLKSGDFPESFKKALAAGTASCLTPLPGVFSPDDAEKIYGKII